MKKKTDSRKLFMDMDLLDLLNNIFVEDEIPFETFEFEHSSNTTYRYSTSKVFNIKDTSNKCFALQEFPGNARLVALQLQGMNIQREVKLNMAFYSTKPFYGGRRRPVALGIMGKNVYLSCVSAEGAPELRLEPMTEEDLERINSNTKKFLFLLTKMSTTTRSFESATSPGSFISASTENNGAITVQLGSSNSHTFEFVLAVDLYGSFLKVGRQRISLQKWEERFGNSCNLYSDYNSACTVGRLETE
ncbi:hypothetical protein FKM82_012061 [Ascaphus truei]